MIIKKAILIASLALTTAALVLVSGCGGSSSGDAPSPTAQKVDDNAKNAMMEYMKTKNAKGGKRSARH